MNRVMSEKEKMLSGALYNALDVELSKDRVKAKSICHQFNLADPTHLDARMALLSTLLDIGDHSHIEPQFFCDFGYNISLGHHFYSNHHLTILDTCEVSIGDYVFIGPHVMISTATHPIDALERQTLESGAPIRIGDNVWIGGNVSILPGVTIGENCVIGAGSVVNKDIPPHSVAAGVPCRVIKSLEPSV